MLNFSAAREENELDFQSKEHFMQASKCWVGRFDGNSSKDLMGVHELLKEMGNF